MATTEEMHVQMRHGFATIGTVIDHQTEAFAAILEPKLISNLACGEEQGTKRCLILSCGFANSWDRFARGDQNVRGCLRCNVAEGNAVLVFIDDVGGNLAVSDLLEQGLVTHGFQRRVC